MLLLLFHISGDAPPEPPVVTPPPEVTGGGYPLAARRRQLALAARKREQQELADEIERLEEHLGIEPDVSDVRRIRALIEKYRRESEALMSNRARRAFDYAERVKSEAAYKLAFREYQRLQEEEELAFLMVLTLD